MWSYYAGSYHGVCIGFDISEKMQELLIKEHKGDLDLLALGGGVYMAKINYLNIPYLLNKEFVSEVMKEMSGTGELYKHVTEIDTIRTIIILSKSQKYNIENEVRLFCSDFGEKPLHTLDKYLKPSRLIIGPIPNDFNNKEKWDTYRQKAEWLEFSYKDTVTIDRLKLSAGRYEFEI